MSPIIDASLAFPTVIFSLFLVVVLLYWVLVVLGTVDMDMFDFDFDGDFGGDLGGDLGADLGDAGADLDGDVDADGDAHGHGTFADILARLDLTEIPLTVSLSLFFLLAWLVCVSAVQVFGAPVTALGIGAALAAGAMVISLLATSRVAVVLKPLFRTFYAPKHKSLLGKTCRITTLKVTDSYGQAEVADGGAGLLIQVRSSNAEELERGSEALIFDYDAENEIFSVKPLSKAAV